MNRLQGRTVAARVEVRGELAPESVELVRERLYALAAKLGSPPQATRGKFTQAGAPALLRPAIAQARFDLDGRPFRVHVAAVDMPEALDLLEERVLRRASLLRDHWQLPTGPAGAPCAWRCDDGPAHRPQYAPRPLGERHIARHKPVLPARQAPEPALAAPSRGLPACRGSATAVGFRKRSCAMPDGTAPSRAGRTVRVFLLDDHEVVRRGVQDLLDSEPGLTVVGEAATAQQAIARVPALRPDVAVLDVRLPDGDGVTANLSYRA